MPGFRRSLALRPVVSLKHENTWSNLAQNASGGITIDQIVGQESPVGAPDVDIASIVKSIFFEFNLVGVDNSPNAQVFHWMIVKNPGKLISFDAILYNQDNKKFILKRGMEMLPEVPLDAAPTIQIKRQFVLKLPPRLRRFDDNDALQLVYKTSSASTINFCGISIFKEFK